MNFSLAASMVGPIWLRTCACTAATLLSALRWLGCIMHSWSGRPGGGGRGASSAFTETASQALQPSNKSLMTHIEGGRGCDRSLRRAPRLQGDLLRPVERLVQPRRGELVPLHHAGRGALLPRHAHRLELPQKVDGDIFEHACGAALRASERSQETEEERERSSTSDEYRLIRRRPRHGFLLGLATCSCYHSTSVLALNFSRVSTYATLSF